MLVSSYLLLGADGRQPAVAAMRRDAQMFGAGQCGGGGGGGCARGVGGPGFGGPAFEGPGFGGPGFGGPGFGGGWGGPGSGGPFKKATVVAALLLDGPADAGEVVKRISKASHGTVKPPTERAELLLSMMAGKGVVSLDNGEATLTELGRNLLAWRGVNADTARAMLGQAEKFADVVKIRRELKATAELARTITWTGTAEQKRTLKEARASILAAVKEAKRSLHESLAAEPADHDGAHDSAESLSAAELKELRTILAKLTQ